MAQSFKFLVPQWAINSLVREDYSNLNYHQLACLKSLYLMLGKALKSRELPMTGKWVYIQPDGVSVDDVEVLLQVEWIVVFIPLEIETIKEI